ncbi:MAG: hypothetical protein DWQ11_06580 [Proteobacteria bacterium]|nr:MAG: hypothetical protein DWQ11_06580 [Pseudomonadota bacterium]
MIRPRHLTPIVFACLMAVAGAAAAQDADGTESSAQLRDRAKTLRKAAEADFASREAGCYDRFRVNACLDDAREDRTAQMQAARKLEARANRIDRGARIKAMEARLRDAEERRANPVSVPLVPLPGAQ